MEVSQIEERLSSVREERLKPRVLMLDVPMDVVSHISEHAVDFPGVAVETVAVREYPNGNVAAHVLGYTGEISEEQIEDNEEFSDYALGDVVGKAGVERSYESVLRGEEGFVRVEVDARGLPHRVLERREPAPERP
jgi:penicillin-binding protein 2